MPAIVSGESHCSTNAASARNAQQKDPDKKNPNFAQALSIIHAVLGEKDAAIKKAERAITLLPKWKDAVDGLGARKIWRLSST